jgi:hypothetical protein
MKKDQECAASSNIQKSILLSSVPCLQVNRTRRKLSCCVVNTILSGAMIYRQIFLCIPYDLSTSYTDA